MTTTQMTVKYSYLPDQFNENSALTNDILNEVKQLVYKGDFTLGSWVTRFEEAVQEKYGVRHCIGLNSGTDALILALKAIGVGYGDVVLTAPNSFVATAGAIVAVGAIPKFVDVGDDYQIDVEKAEHRRIKAVVPVHLTGLAKKYDGWASVVHDSCQAIGAEVKIGTSWLNTCQLPQVSCFSLHPLKNLNVWGDGGFVTTNDDDINNVIRLLRNHGLVDRDHVGIAGINSRLDSMQSIVAFHGLKEIDEINERRRVNAERYEDGLCGLASNIILPSFDAEFEKPVFHTYVVQVAPEVRQHLMAYLDEAGIESKIHYPIPIHRQPGYQYLGYREGDFPQCETQAKQILSLPIHQYLTNEQIDYVIDIVRKFYNGRQLSFREC